MTATETRRERVARAIRSVTETELGRPRLMFTSPEALADTILAELADDLLPEPGRFPPLSEAPQRDKQIIRDALKPKRTQ
jgi:hypothetical protein